MDDEAVADATVLATVDQPPNCEPHDHSSQQFMSESDSTTHVEIVQEQVDELLS